MALRRLLFNRILLGNKKMALLYFGYKAAKYGYGLYRKKGPRKRSKN
ncbi:MAG: hypothetical protein WBG90_21985 [Saonia sp.]